jgi:hypothetical protein
MGSVSVSAFSTPSPSVAANANIGFSDIPTLFGRGAVSLTYAFEILGPAASIPILIDVAGAASAIATSGATYAVQSSWSLFDSGTLLAGDEIRSGQLGGSFSQSFNRTVSILLAANHVYSITMLADASAAATPQNSHVIADAFVDPVFSFGSGVDPFTYTFHFSNGIGNEHASIPGSSVPEPGTLALLGTGLFSFAVFRRRRSFTKSMTLAERDVR